LVERKWLTGTIEAGWILLVVVGVIAAYTGNAEPFVATTDLPGGESANKLPYMVGIAVGLSVAGLGEEVAERVLTGRARNKLIELDNVGRSPSATRPARLWTGCQICPTPWSEASSRGR